MCSLLKPDGLKLIILATGHFQHLWSKQQEAAVLLATPKEDLIKLAK